MALKERDEFSGQMTTGHEWNGIKELNTPVPRLLWLFLISMTLFALVWTLLMPSWPGLSGYFRGLLGVDQQQAVRASLAEAEAERAVWTARLAHEDLTDLAADDAIMAVVRQSGSMLFGDNCAACHGVEARGNIGYPNIAEAPMMWGDDAETIVETIRVGINANHPETRYAQMLAFGRDQMLSAPDITLLVNYLADLSGTPMLAREERDAAATLFADNCAGCHGEDGRGMTDLGAPDLTDAFWTYGGEPAAIRHSIYNGRQGVMPAWEGRLSAAQIRLLGLYVLDLRSATR
ncbi:cytochrome-c oxidase, cbb3-type subunit III [Devosia sp. YIM 151766]|uniref:cytochrome-c oxidase, cbb3-type subunit III n=1 Tax=Devosia sp. YIM 151766 TaxID=3017325 RepID=UPI00255C9B93|nr:cytochrome-c oxidase, cbb3-type subunit III [Devosia sp. YIM 151766]WIY52371.1 cytochrome-c oxidase, cbb3-type subunit III [Devosia sp. YIM 151766]